MADGRPLPIAGEVELDLQVGNVLLKHRVLLADVEEEGILGTDFLIAHGCQLDLVTLTMTLDDELGHPIERSWLAWVQAAVSLRCCWVTTVSEVVLEPWSRVVIPAGVKQPAPGKQWCVEPDPDVDLPDCLRVARALVEVSYGTVPVQVTNLSPDTVVLRSELMVGPLEEVDGQQCCEGAACCHVHAVEGTSVPSHLQDLLEASGQHLSSAEREQVAQLLAECSGAFAESDDDMGRTGLVQHQIVCKDAKPVKQRLRRLPPARHQELTEHVDKLLRQGAIKLSTSPWCSPIVAVTKKDGSTRFCVDYRALNSVTEKDAFPLPRTDTYLESLGGNSFFCTLDLLAGYHQVEVAEEDRPKTAFTTGTFLYQYKIMPFGLCNAPGTFQRLMELVLAGLQWTECLVYLDNVIVYGLDFETTLKRLKTILGKLQAAGLKLKPRKCQLFQRQVSFLGHIVSTEG